MKMETQTIDSTTIFDSLSPKRTRSPYPAGKPLPARALNFADSQSDFFLDSILRDDIREFISLAKRLFTGEDAESERTRALKLLNLCCRYDAVDCASSLINGDAGGVVPYINGVEVATGLSPLHTAAEAQAARCTEMLLKQCARTDVRSRDGRAMLPLELSLRSLHVIWSPTENSVVDLILSISEVDLTVVTLLAEKTKDLETMVYATAVDGLVVPLAALLIVSSPKIKDATVEWHGADPVSKQKITIYEAVIQEVLGVRWQNRFSLKRMLLLQEIELLKLFNADVFSERVDKKLTSPLITAALAGDEAILQLLLKTKIDVNEIDSEGNTALLCCLKSSSVPCMQQIRIMCLLIERGAHVSQRNKLGISALHFAAANGNLTAVEILLFKNPDSINFKTEINETPLFFAVKNNHLACVELLLRWGANTEVCNLRKQRPIDQAESQEMRFMLNQTHISRFSQSNLDTSLSQLNYSDLSTDEETAFERCRSLTKLEICKYFESPTGCARGSKCFYVHGEKELQQHPPLEKPVSTGGLCHSRESGENLTPQSNSCLQSRGHGSVTFGNENVSEAVQAQYLDISEKRVEDKTDVEKSIMLDDIRKHQSVRYDEENTDDKYQTQILTMNERTATANSCFNNKENHPSWAEMLLHHQPTKSCTSTSKTQVFCDKTKPVWLKKFVTWLPRFLQHASENGREGGYPLSSLKGDFRATFSMELDHASLGYHKLSDFIKSFPKLCKMEAVPVGKCGPATHWVLLPSCSQLKGRPLQPLMIIPNTNEIIFDGHVPIHDPKTALSFSDVICSNNFTQKSNAASELGLPDQTLSFSNSHSRQLRHPVLETLARVRNNTSVFFLREFDFYQSYEACIRQGMCFWCNKAKLLWGNFPCQHKLWCTDCKQEAVRAAGRFEHRCVICDNKVESFILTPLLTDLPNNNEITHALEI